MPRRLGAGRVGAGVVAVLLAMPMLCVLAPGVVHAAPAGPSTSPAAGAVTEGQALAQAAATGTAVPVTSATTPSSTLTANPDGTLSLTHTAQPVRARRNGSWVPLDATLHTNPDGSISANMTASPVVLSGGGIGPLATLTSAGHRLSETWPTPLPAPTLDGSRATYPGVLPGVDLVVSVNDQGAVSEVLVVKTAAAAANPALASLTLQVASPDLSIRADPAGNLTAAAGNQTPAFVAGAPKAWDSSTTPAAAVAGVDTPSTSTVDGPGDGAQVAAVPVSVTGANLTLTPPASLLTGPGTGYPVFIDPQWIPVGPSLSAWATVSDVSPDHNYWKSTPDPEGQLQAGYSGSLRSHTLLRFPYALSTLRGATIHSVQMSITEVDSFSCNPSSLRLYAPATDLSTSNATWNSWPASALGTNVATISAAHGHDSSCPAASVNFSNTDSGAIINTVRADIAAGRQYKTFALTGADETSKESWKEFDRSSASMTITYDHTPTVPSRLSTDPATACAAAPPDVVGDAGVSLFVQVADPDGGSVGADIQLSTTAAFSTILAASSPANLITSGSTAVLPVPETTMKNAAGTTLTQFFWRARVTDTNLTSGWSATCSFSFDPTRPSDKPDITQPTDATIGSPLQVAVTWQHAGTPPAAYLYQLNGGPPGQVTADASGKATIDLVPGRSTNVVTATAMSAGGNLGTVSARAVFPATPAAVAADADLTGDGVADLVTSGVTTTGTPMLPAGIWQAAGKNNGQLATTAANIGINGNGFTGDQKPADFTDAQVITGHFTGTGSQDVMIYYPNGHNGVRPGEGAILAGSGDGSIIQTQLLGEGAGLIHLQPSDLADLNVDNHHIPLQVVNAGDTSASGSPYPDLIATNIDGAGVYYLDYYQNSIPNNYQTTRLSTQTPTSDNNWNNWTLASAQTATGTGLFLWNKTTGALWLWTNLTVNLGAGTLTPGATYELSRTGPWNQGATLALQAADIDGNGTPDLWTVGAGDAAHPGPQVTAWLTSITGTTAAIDDQDPQALTTASHTWMLNDTGSGTVAAAADTGAATPLGLTGTGDAAWHTGDLYEPDIQLKGANGALFTSGPALTTNDSFTVSAWVKPDASSGTVVSQDSTNTAGFRIWAEPTDSTWHFGMPTTDTTTSPVNVAAGGTVQPGIWTHLTGTYTATSHTAGTMALYVNGVKTATATHTTPTIWTAGGGLRIGDTKTGTAHVDHLAGQVAQVQTWNQPVNPQLNATPASWYHPVTQTRILDTRANNGPPIPAGGIRHIPVTGGTTGVPTDGTVAAVAVNLTAVTPASSGYLTAFPDNTPKPITSTLNTAAGTTIANYTIVPVGTNGGIAVYTTGSTHLLVDITGYYTSKPDATGITGYNPLTPTRILDTRTGLGGTTGPIGSGAPVTLTVTGATGVPAGAIAAAINFTTANQSAAGFLTTYPHLATPPAVSGLQYQPSQPIAGMSIVTLSTDGKIDIRVSPGSTTQIIADVVGYYTSDSTGPVGLAYHPTPATRIVDSATPIAANTHTPFNQGNTVIADHPTLITNITATGGTSNGFAVTYPDGTTQPNTSDVDWVTGQSIANLALPTTGTGTSTGTIDVYNGGTGAVKIIIDILGYFAPN